MRNRLLMPLLLLSTLPGCLLGPDHLQPQSDLPSGWMVPAADSAAATVTPTIDPHWWHLFDDPALTALIEEALQHNADLSVAAARIAEARALGVNSTPTLFINGRKIAGYVPWENLKQIIDLEIGYQATAKNAGEACCALPPLSPVKPQ